MAVCVAPRIMGTSMAAVGDLGIRELAGLIKQVDVQMQQFGVDIVFDGRVVYG